MRRREFITLLSGAVAWPIAGYAQQPKRKRIGVLMNLAEDDPQTKARVAAFRQGLEKRGWSDDRNIHFDYRFRASTAERIPDRKSTRLNSSHLGISYAVFCLKKKTT